MLKYRNQGQNDERRRRILLEESNDDTSGGPATIKMTPEAALARPAYSEGSAPENQARVTDFIPIRWWTVLLAGLAGFVGLGCLSVLHYNITHWANWLSPEESAVFDLTRGAGCGATFAAMTFAASALVALLLYVLRQHKANDYRGRYRIWLWACGLFTTASLVTAAGLHVPLEATLAHFTDIETYASPRLATSSVYALIMGSLGFFLWRDMRESRLADWACVTAAIGYLLTAILNWIDGPATVIIGSCILLGAHYCLFFAVMSYARFVILDTQGLVAVRRWSQKKVEEENQDQPKEKQKTEPAEEKQRKKPGLSIFRGRKMTDATKEKEAKPAAAEKKAPPAKKPLKETTTKKAAQKSEPKKQAPPPPAEEPATVSLADSDIAAEFGMTPEEYGELSKSERRRMRKQMRRQMRRAA